jgi:membrane protease YdiL (CAAX protease family)
LAYFVLYLLLFNTAWTMWVLLGYPHLRNLGEQTLAYALINIGIRLVIWILPVFAYLRYVDRVNPIAYLKLRQHWRRGVLVALIFSLLNFGLTALQHGLPHHRSAAISWNSILSTSLLIGFVEEIPYRGFVFQKLHERFSLTVATLVSSLLFFAIHLPGWISLHLFSVATAVFVFVFGILMVVLLRYAKSLWAPIIAHSLNDFFSAVLFRV